MTDPTPLDRWRAAAAALTAARARIDAETVRVAREGREVYARHASPKARARLLPVPDDLLTGPLGPRVLEGKWADLLTPAQREAARPELEALAAPLREAWDALPAVERAAREAAAQVPEPVGVDAPDAAWRLVDERWPSAYGSQGSGAEHYARARASLAARRLAGIGYRTRCVVRLRARLDGRTMRTFEAWAWTTPEGARCARWQQPPSETYDDLLRAAAAEGANPAALLGAPIADVARAGADEPGRLERPRPLTWEQLTEGEDLP